MCMCRGKDKNGCDSSRNKASFPLSLIFRIFEFPTHSPTHLLSQSSTHLFSLYLYYTCTTNFLPLSYTHSHTHSFSPLSYTSLLFLYHFVSLSFTLSFSLSLSRTLFFSFFSVFLASQAAWRLYRHLSEDVFEGKRMREDTFFVHCHVLANCSRWQSKKSKKWKHKHERKARGENRWRGKTNKNPQFRFSKNFCSKFVYWLKYKILNDNFLKSTLQFYLTLGV